jgi:hypothetical protein
MTISTALPFFESVLKHAGAVSLLQMFFGGSPMRGFAHVKRPALFFCLTCALIAVSAMPSKAAMNSYVNLKGQKSGAIKGSVTQTPKVNTRVNVHPVIPHIKVK